MALTDTPVYFRSSSPLSLLEKFTFITTRFSETSSPSSLPPSSSLFPPVSPLLLSAFPSPFLNSYRFLSPLGSFQVLGLFSCFCSVVSAHVSIHLSWDSLSSSYQRHLSGYTLESLTKTGKAILPILQTL